MINYAEKLKSTNSGGLANADDIAYEVTTGVDGDGESMETGFTSVKEAIDGLKLQIQDGIDVVDEQQILSYATRAETAAESASTTEQSIQNIQTAVIRLFNSNIELMQLKKEEFEESVTLLDAKLDSVLDTANTLKYGFDNGTNFAIISEQAYEELVNNNNVANNVIYFLYD